MTALRRLWPQRVRTRLAVFYALLFLVAGLALLALTYTLLVHVLLPAQAPFVPKGGTPRPSLLLNECKLRGAPGQPPMSSALLAKCSRAEAAAGGSDARAATLSALRLASLIGLGVLAFASAGLGWLVSGRALRPVRSITEAARRASELRLGERPR
jgi:hypothetical protein